MLDAYHRDGEHKEALEITNSLVEQFPENTIALRNQARAMNKLGGFATDAILETYRKAVIVKFPGDYSALWYGSFLSDIGRLVDSVEAHVYACTLDLDDPECFSRLAQIMSDVVQPRNVWQVNDENRPVPSFIDSESVIKSIMFAVDCPGYGASQKFICEQALRNIGFGIEELGIRLEEAGELTRTDRRNFVEPLYEKLKTGVTLKT